MKQLTRHQITELISEMRQAASDSKTWEAWHNSNVFKSACLEFPVGELFNPAILGFLWAWKLRNLIEVTTCTQTDSMNANGLEGKVKVNIDLPCALLAYSELPEYRRQLSI